MSILDLVFGAQFDPKFGRPAAVSSPKLVVGSGWWKDRPNGRHHAGIDLGMPEGTPILAISDGTVIRSQKTPSGDAGIWVGLQHKQGIISRYMHMTRTAVDVGQTVRKGQIIGYSGNTGLSSAPHLHLDLKVHPAVIPFIEAEIGKPTTGYAPSMEDYGVGIPGEPWVPVDGYWESTSKQARNLNIPLYAERVETQRLKQQVKLKAATPYIALTGAGLAALGSLAFVLRR